MTCLTFSIPGSDVLFAFGTGVLTTESEVLPANMQALACAQGWQLDAEIDDQRLCFVTSALGESLHDHYAPVAPAGPGIVSSTAVDADQRVTADYS